MKKLYIILLLCFLLLGLTNTAHSLGAYSRDMGEYGNAQKLHYIYDKDNQVYSFKDGNDKIDLGFLTTTHNFVVGIYMTNDGYILIKGNRYIPFDKELFGQLQKDGLLPTPLPEYSIPIIDYFFGYLFWFTIPLGFFMFTRRKQSK